MNGISAGSDQHSFAYVAEDSSGGSLQGTLTASDEGAARQRLEGLGLRITQIEATKKAIAVATPVAKSLNSADLIAFNEQFAQLAAAGLPVEYGLRLIAEDLQRGRLANSVRALVADLERGASLSEAFDRHAGEFPPLYGRLVDAGIRSNNLAGLLMNLGRHLETMRRLRAAIWRAVAYPVMVILLLGIVLVMIQQFILPQFATMYAEFSKLHVGSRYDFRTGMYIPAEPMPTLPVATQILFVVAKGLPVAFGVLVLVLLLGPSLLKRAARDSREAEQFSWKLPLIGPILRRSLIARWCESAALAVSSGMDLPRAIRLAGEAIHSPSLTLDALNLAEHVEAGRPIDTPGEYAVLPATVPAAMQLATRTGNTSATLHSLAELYEQQCRLRVENLPALLTPVLLALVAILIGFVIFALIQPVVQFIRYAGL